MNAGDSPSNRYFLHKSYGTPDQGVERQSLSGTCRQRWYEREWGHWVFLARLRSSFKQASAFRRAVLSQWAGLKAQQCRNDTVMAMEDTRESNPE